MEANLICQEMILLCRPFCPFDDSRNLFMSANKKISPTVERTIAIPCSDGNLCSFLGALGQIKTALGEKDSG
jgi:hypothetical protein